MTVYKEFNIGGQKGGSPFGSFGAVIGLILFFVMLFFLAKGIFYILSFVAPILFIATLFIDHNVVLDYGKFILKLLKDNVIVGILGVLLTLIGFPIVSGFLFFKALARRTINKKLDEMGMGRPKEEEYSDYEEVEEEIDFLELPKVEHVKASPKSSDTNEYEDLFE